MSDCVKTGSETYHVIPCTCEKRKCCDKHYYCSHTSLSGGSPSRLACVDVFSAEAKELEYRQAQASYEIRKAQAKMLLKDPANPTCPVCGKPAERYFEFICCGHECYEYLKEVYE